jgi:leucyl aminopeptidase
MHRLTLRIYLREQELEVASTLSQPSALAAAAITYPSTLSHQAEANALISGISASGQQTFLKTLTE